MYLMSTPEERHPESSAVSSPVCLNTKMTRDLVITPKEKVSRRMALLLQGVYLHQVDWLSIAPNFLTARRPHSKDASPATSLRGV